MNIDDIIENFEYLDDWDDRYRYLIELGDLLEPISDEERIDENKVHGCVSQVWLSSMTGEGDDPEIRFRGTSDAHLVSGLVAITLAIFSGKKASEILALDENAIFDKIHLSEHITPQRSNGLRSLIQKIKQTATIALKS